jgi:hypothetical protein
VNSNAPCHDCPIRVLIPIIDSKPNHRLLTSKPIVLFCCYSWSCYRAHLVLALCALVSSQFRTPLLCACSGTWLCSLCRLFVELLLSKLLNGLFFCVLIYMNLFPNDQKVQRLPPLLPTKPKTHLYRKLTLLQPLSEPLSAAPLVNSCGPLMYQCQ